MKPNIERFYELIDFNQLEHHEMFLNLHTNEEYELVFDTIRELIIEGLENQTNKKFTHRDIKYLIPASFVYSSWTLTRILKTGRNDLLFNKLKLNQILKETELSSKLNPHTYSDFILTGLGMCITQISEHLNLNNEQSCKLLISACLIAADQIFDIKEARAA